MKTKLNEDALADIVVIANTPTYLFAKFRQDPGVQSLAAEYSAEELARMAVDYAGRVDRTLSDKIFSYAFLAALSFKARLDVVPALLAFPAPKLDWGFDFTQLILSAAPTDTLISIDLLPPDPVELQVQRNPASVSITRSEVPHPVAVLADMASVSGNNQRSIQVD